MDKEAKYTQLIHSLSLHHSESNQLHQNSTNSKHALAEQIMKSGGNGIGTIQEENKKSTKRRDRSLTTGSVPDDGNSKSSVNSKLPPVSYHRHNFARAFHCYDY